MIPKLADSHFCMRLGIHSLPSLWTRYAAPCVNCFYCSYYAMGAELRSEVLRELGTCPRTMGVAESREAVSGLYFQRNAQKPPSALSFTVPYFFSSFLSLCPSAVRSLEKKICLDRIKLYYEEFWVSLQVFVCQGSTSMSSTTNLIQTGPESVCLHPARCTCRGLAVLL